MNFCFHTALKMCSIGHLLRVNFVFVRPEKLFFGALSENKIPIRAKLFSYLNSLGEL